MNLKDLTMKIVSSFHYFGGTPPFKGSNDFSRKKKMIQHVPKIRHILSDFLIESKDWNDWRHLSDKDRNAEIQT